MISFRIALFTLIEDVTLVLWLTLVRSGSRALGALTLPVGFFIEHIVATNVKNGAPLLNLKAVPLGRLAVNAVLEMVIWVVWLLLWPYYQFSIAGVGIPAIAIAFLELGLIVEHSLTDNIFHGRPLFTNLFSRKVIGFSTLENVAATGWLGLLGAGLPALAVTWLVIFQYLEHARAIAVGKQP